MLALEIGSKSGELPSSNLSLPLGALTSKTWFEMGPKSDFKKDFLFERDNIYLKGEGLF